MSQNLKKIYTANILGTSTRFDVMPETRTVIVNGVTYTEDECAALAAMMAKALEYLDEDAPDPTGEMKYPPCDLREAEVGDIIQSWSGGKCVVDFVNDNQSYQIECTVFNLGEEIGYCDFSADGIFWPGCPDSKNNARFLHKKPAQEVEESE